MNTGVDRCAQQVHLMSGRVWGVQIVKVVLDGAAGSGPRGVGCSASNTRLGVCAFDMGVRVGRAGLQVGLSGESASWRDRIC